MAAPAFDSEVDLARVAVDWLNGYGWAVYQEVQVPGRRPVADLVAVRRHVVWVLECKRSLSLALLEQAADWVGRAHYVSIVTPQPRRGGRGPEFTTTLVRRLGLGWLEIAQPGRADGGGVFERAKAPVLRQALVDPLRQALDARQQTYAAAGNAQGRRWTPFKRTSEALRELTAAEPGVLLTAAVARVPHHYKTPTAARNALAKWLRQGVISGVHLRRVGERLRLYPDVGWEQEPEKGS